MGHAASSKALCAAVQTFGSAAKECEISIVLTKALTKHSTPRRGAAALFSAWLVHLPIGMPPFHVHYYCNYCCNHVKNRIMHSPQEYVSSIATTRSRTYQWPCDMPGTMSALDCPLAVALPNGRQCSSLDVPYRDFRERYRHRDNLRTLLQ